MGKLVNVLEIKFFFKGCSDLETIQFENESEANNWVDQIQPEIFSEKWVTIEEEDNCTCEQDSQDETKFFNEHGCCQWCYYVGE
jgi:hypothetical protein